LIIRGIHQFAPFKIVAWLETLEGVTYDILNMEERASGRISQASFPSKPSQVTEQQRETSTSKRATNASTRDQYPS